MTRAENCRRLAADPAYKAKRLAVLNSPEVKARATEARRRPDVIAKMKATRAAKRAAKHPPRVVEAPPLPALPTLAELLR